MYISDNRHWLPNATPSRRDRRQGDIVPLQKGHSDPSDKIGGAVDAGKALENLRCILKVIDERHDFGAVATEIVAQRRPLPINLHRRIVFCVKRALAVSETGNEGPSAFLAENIARRIAVAAERVLDDFGQPFGDLAEEVMSGVQDLAEE